MSKPRFFAHSSPQQLLETVFQERSDAQPSYTLKAYAKALGLTVQQLSAFLKKKKGMSAERARFVAEEIELSQSEKELFILSIQAQFSRSADQRKIARNHLAAYELKNLKSRKLSEEAFQTISEWYHYALLELIKVMPPQSQSHASLSKKLSVPEPKIKLALQRLVSLGLVSELKGGGWKGSQDVVSSPSGISSLSLRKFHRQVLEKALIALDEQDPSIRSVTSCLMPVNTRQIPQVKKMIQNFNQSIMKEISQPDPDQVYALSVQFFRIDQDD